MLKKFGVVVLSTGLVFSGLNAGSSIDAAKPTNPGNGNGNGHKGKVENIIFMIPDGFSSNYASNYRIYKGEDAVWDQHLKGMFTTSSANSDVTDSAAAGTAMATGKKTNNGVIGLGPEGNTLETILESSEKVGKSSGLVATSTITHATPASFATHVKDRNNETEISRQLIDSKVDVLLGGGKDNFLPASEGGNQESLHLIEKAKEKGFEFVENRNELHQYQNHRVEEGDKLLGLFADDALSPELHREETSEPSLSSMTKTAIDVLEEDKDGFFLMVEGSQIDWAGHANDAAWAMSDVQAFEAAVEEAIEFAKKDGKTLVVVAADHDTGGITTGANDSLDLNAGVLQKVTATGEYMASQINEERSNIDKVIQTYTGFELKENEIQTIAKADDITHAINTVISQRAHIGWTSTNHTGADIPVYAFGPQSNRFTGFHDNTDLPDIMKDALHLK
ncbi:alkaline phosphatase [Salinibacillus kushneri]|uniref:Alkaline phosphatase n=1 Tax=Salinibacillus kushneri TaxID=237682 RepID=A0A1I0EVX7_9BACI|nr:alkaline phosphatase [Salinibacillus kushneri]SET49781.1 alkaline phosphatase [Salinibacillus kushneri]